MKKILLGLSIMGITSTAVFADYIPYEDLSNYTFSKNSGWRALASDSVLNVSLGLGENRSKLEIAITKRLYNELKTHADYKNNLSVTEWTDSNNTKSYSYNVLLPFSLVDDLPKKVAFGIKLEHKSSKICKGIADISKDGMTTCTADKLEDIVTK